MRGSISFLRGFGRTRPDYGQPLRLSKWKLLQQDSMNYRVDGDVSAKGEADQDHGRKSEQRLTNEHGQSQFHITENTLEKSQERHLNRCSPRCGEPVVRW